MKRFKLVQIVFFLALILYGATSSLYPFAGESVQLIVSHSGISPFLVHGHPLWTLLTHLTRLLPLPLGFILNALSVLFGAFSVALAYMVFRDSKLDSDYDEKTPAARQIIGIAGALYLMTVLPVWMFCNRAHYASLDLMLFLLAVRNIQLYAGEGRSRNLVGFAILMGFGVIESSTFLAAFPFLGLYLVYLMWQNKDLTFKPIAMGVAAFLIPLSLYFMPAWLYTLQPVFEWGGARNLWHAAWLVYSSAGRALLGQLNQVGWMILLMVSLIPFVGAMWIKKSQPVENRPFSILLVALIVIGLTGTLWFNVKIAPWMLLSASLDFIMPHLLIAYSFAVSLGFWFAVFKDRAQRKDRRHRRAGEGKRLEIAFFVFVAILAIAAAILNFDRVKPRGNSKFYRLASSMVENMAPRDTMIAPGLLDQYLAVAANDQDADLDLINLEMVSHPLYRKYIESIVATPRLASLANYSLQAMLKEWIRKTPDISQKLAIYHSPSLWQECGYIPVASHGVYFGEPDKEIDAEKLFEHEQLFWQQIGDQFRVIENPANRAELLTAQTAMLLSQNINNLGVLMEFREKPDLAQKCYKQSLEINARNPSSLLNLYALKEAKGAKDQELLVRIEEFVAKRDSLKLEQVMKNYGFIRNKSAMETLGEIFTAVHRPQKQAPPSESQQKASPEDIERLKNISRLVRDNKTREAIDICREILDEHPEYDKVWILLGELAYKAREYDIVEECIEQMVKSKEFWPQLVVLSGQIAMRKGEIEKARNAFESVLMRAPKNLQVLESLVKLDSMAGNTRRGRMYLNRLLSLDSDNFIANYTLGGRCYEDGDYDMALSAYEKCLGKGKSSAVLNNMAWILNLQGQYLKALDMANQSIGINRGLASTWDTLATIHINLGNYGQARKAIDKALELEPDSVSAKISSIVLEMADGDPTEARGMARDLKTSEAPLNDEQSSRIEKILQ